MSSSSSTPKKGSILVTGANGGLGSAIVEQIVSTPLGKDYHGLYPVRNPGKADALNGILQHRRAGSAHEHTLVKLDLGSLASVRECAAQINKRVAEGSLPPIRALILNAAFQDGSDLTMSSDGFDMSFQVNYLAHFLFTLLLLQSMDKTHGRIVVIGSWTHDADDPRNENGITAGAYAGKYRPLFRETEALARGTWSTPQDDPSFHNGYRRYGVSKLCEVMFMFELQERLSRDAALSGISVLGVDPGAMSTGIMRNGSWFNRVIVMRAVSLVAPVTTRLQGNKSMLRTTSKSAADALRACFDTETLGERPRAMYLDGSEEKTAGAEARDVKNREILWHDSIGYVELKEGDTALQYWR